MNRRLVTILSIGSLFLSVLISAFWRSSFQDSPYIASPKLDFQAEIYRGSLRLVSGGWDGDPKVFDAGTVAGFFDGGNYAINNGQRKFAAFGFACGDASLAIDMTSIPMRFVELPLWFVVPILLMLPAYQLVWIIKGLQKKPGTCPSCGYDLRATPERCPECGRVATKL